MKITLNNKLVEVSSNLTLQQLLINLKINMQGKAIGINNNIIKHNDWQSRTIKDGDEIILITIAQGG